MTLKDDHFRLSFGRRTILLPHASGVALVERLDRSDSASDLRDALRRSDASEGVSLTAAQAASLINVIERWAIAVVGDGESLPQGIARLRDALCDPTPDPTDGHPRTISD